MPAEVLEQQDQAQQPQGPTAFEEWAKLPEKEQADVEAAAVAATVEPETAAQPEPEASGEENTEAEAGKKTAGPLKGLEKRIKGFTDEIRNLKEKLDAVTAARPAAEAKPGEVEPVEPNVGDFADYKEYEAKFKAYVKELTRYEARQLRAEEQQTADQQKAEQFHADAKASWEAKVAAVEHEDFEEVALSPTLKVSHAMFAVIQASDHGANLLYHLGKNPDLSESIAKLPPAAAALAIGKLEAKLFPDGEPEKKAAPPAVSKAPKPVKPVGQAAGGVDLGKEPDPKDFKAWNKWKDRQEAADD